MNCALLSATLTLAKCKIADSLAGDCGNVRYPAFL
jgi:hypothetical protein